MVPPDLFAGTFWGPPGSLRQESSAAPFAKAFGQVVSKARPSYGRTAGASHMYGRSIYALQLERVQDELDFCGFGFASKIEVGRGYIESLKH